MEKIKVLLVDDDLDFGNTAWKESTTSDLPQKTSLSCVYLRYMIQNSKLRLPIMVP